MSAKLAQLLKCFSPLNILGILFFLIIFFNILRNTEKVLFIRIQLLLQDQFLMKKTELSNLILYI